MAKNKKTVLVTGALGHIGSRLIRDISPSVGKVVMLDNFLTQRYASLFDLPEGRVYEFYEDDITTADFKKYLDGVDAVIHLAAITNAEATIGKEKETEAVNFKGLQRVADACRDAKVPLLFPSSTSVYGSQSAVVDESCSELVPQSPYAQSKLAAENYLLSQKGKGLRFVICRFGTIFGWSVGMRFHTAVNKFIWQAVNGLPISVWKTAWDQKRPYLDLGDCVRAVNFIIEEDLFDGEVYNILTKNFAVKDIVETIQTFVPSLKVSYVDSKIMNQLSYDVSDAKMRNAGFTPSGNLKRGIGATIKHLSAITKD